MSYIITFIAGLIIGIIATIQAKKKPTVYTVDSLKEIGNAKIHIDDNNNDNIFK